MTKLTSFVYCICFIIVFVSNAKTGRLNYHRGEAMNGIPHVRDAEPSGFLIVDVCSDDEGEVQGFTRNDVATPPGRRSKTQRDHEQKNRIREKENERIWRRSRTREKSLIPAGIPLPIEREERDAPWGRFIRRKPLIELPVRSLQPKKECRHRMQWRECT